MKKNIFNNVSQLIFWLLSCIPNTQGNASIYERHVSLSSPFLYWYINKYIYISEAYFFWFSCLLSRCSTTSVERLFFYFLKSLAIKCIWIHKYIQSYPLANQMKSVFGPARGTICTSQLKTCRIYFSHLYFPFLGTGLIHIIFWNQLSLHLIFVKTLHYQLRRLGPFR